MPLETVKLNEDTDVVKEADQCETPKYAMPMLLQYISKDMRIWESACGSGRMVKHLIDFGYKVPVSCDLSMGPMFNYFNLYHRTEEWKKYYDIDITNLPFSIEYKWLQEAILRGKPFAFIVPYKSMEEKVTRLYVNNGCQLIVPYQRIKFYMPHEGWYRCNYLVPFAPNKSAPCHFMQKEKFVVCPICGTNKDIKKMESTPQIKTMWFTYGLNLPSNVVWYDMKEDIKRYPR